jgi:hypothetical protein
MVIFSDFEHLWTYKISHGACVNVMLNFLSVYFTRNYFKILILLGYVKIIVAFTAFGKTTHD